MLNIKTAIVVYDNVLGQDKWSEDKIIQNFGFEDS